MKFDRIAIDLTFDKTRHVDPVDDEDTGIRRDIIFHSRYILPFEITENAILGRRNTLHHHLDWLIDRAERAMDET